MRERERNEDRNLMQGGRGEGMCCRRMCAKERGGEVEEKEVGSICKEGEEGGEEEKERGHV